MEIAVNKLNFTVGPVKMADSIKKVGGQEIPYFRTSEFSELMLENEKLLRKMLYADDSTRILSLTGSGTAGMEAAIINTLGKADKVLVVNGGSFGERFVNICRIHKIPCEEIVPAFGNGVTEEELKEYEGKGYTAVLVNYHETSTGVLYDLKLIGDFCKRNHCFLIVDAISAFLADTLKMQEWGINVVITGSQKGYAIPPGLSFVALDEQAIKRVYRQECGSLYFDFKSYLKDGERGQTPFTPAVGILIQLNRKLNELVATGLEQEKERIANLAEHFRKGIKSLPLTIASNALSNAVTPLLVRQDKSAYEVFQCLETEYGIWVCPSGGELRDRMFRVGHLGALTIEDNLLLLNALEKLYKNGVL